METCELEDRTLTIFTRQINQAIRIEIIDNGPGIPEDLRFKIFEPFFSTKSAFKAGRGIGLSMAQEIILQHSGTLAIDPSYKQGCNMVVEIPCN